MWVAHTITSPCRALGLPPFFARPLLTYLDELSYHLDEDGLQASTDLEQATANLEAVLDKSDEHPFDVVAGERKWRTAIGYLLKATIDRCPPPSADRDDALRARIRQLDTDLE